MMSTVVILAGWSQVVLPQAGMEPRPRVRDLGLKIGILPVGKENAITDVAGVIGRSHDDHSRRQHPHRGHRDPSAYRESVPGESGGSRRSSATVLASSLVLHKVNELGEIETPILLTSTLSVPKTADFLMDYMLALPGNENVQSINPLVAETNDGFLNDIRGRNITRDDVFSAIKSAKSGPVQEGSVGAGTGNGRVRLEGRDRNIVRESCPRRSEATRSAFWFSRTSVVFCRSMAYRLELSWASIT
jgi:D-aminopeptidase